MAEFTILGGGLVGPALAVALASRNHTVRLYDCGPLEGRQLGEPGRAVNITLCARGLRALQQLGLRQAALAESVPLYGRSVRSRDGGVTDEAYGPAGEALFAIRRSELRHLLVSAAHALREVTLFAQARCTAVDLERRTITVRRNECEEQVPFRHLLAADGVNSVVRGTLSAAGVTHAETTVIGMGYRELTLNSAASNTLGLHRQALHFWPRGQAVLIGFPNTDHSTTLSLHLPVAGRRHAYQAVRTDYDFRRLFQSEFPDVLPHLPADLTPVMNRPLGKMSTVRCNPWHVDDRVLLVGDSAHGIIPYYGQGANAGFEDCVTLRDLLEVGGDVGAAFAAFQQRRQPDMDLISDLCFEHLKLLCSGLGRDDRALRAVAEQQIWQHTEHRSLYHHVSFTAASYREAVEKSRAFEALLDRVVARLKAGGVARAEEIVGSCIAAASRDASQPLVCPA